MNENSKKANYNKAEYLELINKKKTLELEKDEFQKYSSYCIPMNDYLNWCLREKYFELLENFCEEKIDMGEFSLRFEETGRVVSEIVDILESNEIILSPTEESIEFAKLLEEVFDQSFEYVVNLDSLNARSLKEQYEEEIDFPDQEFEVEFRNSIKESYLKVQNFFNEKK